jgi:hypothetical protein
MLSTHTYQYTPDWRHRTTSPKVAKSLIGSWPLLVKRVPHGRLSFHSVWNTSFHTLLEVLPHPGSRPGVVTLGLSLTTAVVMYVPRQQLAAPLLVPGSVVRAAVPGVGPAGSGS